MKKSFLFLLLAFITGAQSQAQTWFYLPVTNFIATPGSWNGQPYTGSNSYTMGTNELLRVHNVFRSNTTGPVVVNATLLGGGSWLLNSSDVVLGPARLDVVAGSGTNDPTPFASLLLESVLVNGSAWTGATLVQPAGQTALLSVQSSTNLTTWTTITNSSFPKTNVNRFFRTSLAIP